MTRRVAPVVQAGVAKGFPQVQGFCPACRRRTLFVGAGGYITCSYLPCPNPTAVADMLGRRPENGLETREG